MVEEIGCNVTCVTTDIPCSYVTYILGGREDVFYSSHYV